LAFEGDKSVINKIDEI